MQSNNRCTGPSFDPENPHNMGVPMSCKSLGIKHTDTK